MQHNESGPLTVAAVARLLNRSEKVIRSLSDAGILPHVRDTSGRRLYGPQAVDAGFAHLAAQRVRRSGSGGT